ncbi:DNA-directed RNA polymerase [Babesia ovis]|uniref:DNA-directed RNA polymerase n=1 Tax=Babesia ovis TaxID=5869 RepID=A0A9W5TF75_BABOV|nr:DNA-directed RNA polymerase [Babesia ovis]
MVFILLNSDVSTANALRRIMLSEIPSLAIEVVTVLENTSVLHDEYIAHRLGLLPIDSNNARNFEYRDKCNCSDKCSRCTVEYELDVKCTGDSRIVTHYDIKLDNWEGARGAASAPMPVPKPSMDTFSATYGNVTKGSMDGSRTLGHDQLWMAGATPSGHPNALGSAGDQPSFSTDVYQRDFYDTDTPSGGIPIVKLKRGQSVSMKMTATKGMGKFHAKWMVANVAYKMEPVITINKQEADKLGLNEKTQIVQSCPRKVFKLSTPDNSFSTATKSDLVVDNNLNCIYCDECLNQAREMGLRDLIRIHPDETKFHFTVESNGAIPPERILEICLDTLEEKLGSLQQHFLEAQARSLGSKTQVGTRPGAPHHAGPSGIDLD